MTIPGGGGSAFELERAGRTMDWLREPCSVFARSMAMGIVDAPALGRKEKREGEEAREGRRGRGGQEARRRQSGF